MFFYMSTTFSYVKRLQYAYITNGLLPLPTLYINGRELL